MANKLFYATLALCFLLTNASIYRTVVELETNDDTHLMRPQEKCGKEFQQEQHLRACQQWIHQQASHGQGGGYEEDDFVNPQGPHQGQSQILQQCCNELHQEDPECVCPTLQAAAGAVSRHAQQGQQGQQGQQAQHFYQTAKHLPQVCNIPQVGVCPFQASLHPHASSALY